MKSNVRQYITMCITKILLNMQNALFRGFGEGVLHTNLYNRIWVCRISLIYCDTSRPGERMRYMTLRLIGDIPTRVWPLVYRQQISTTKEKIARTCSQRPRVFLSLCSWVNAFYLERGSLVPSNMRRCQINVQFEYCNQCQVHALRSLYTRRL